MTTLYRVDYHKKGSPGVIHNEIRPENIWVFEEGVRMFRKRDGTAAMIKSGKIYKRYDCKQGKTPPEGAIPCQDPDELSGHWPHWVECIEGNPSDKGFLSVDISGLQDGTYELCGEKIGGNPEGFIGHQLIKHDSEEYPLLVEFQCLKEFLAARAIEGVVYHHKDGRMCKLRKADFGLEREMADVPRLRRGRSNTKTIQYEGVTFEVEYYLEMANHTWELDTLELSSVRVGGQELIGPLSQDTYTKLLELLEKS